MNWRIVMLRIDCPFLGNQQLIFFSRVSFPVGRLRLIGILILIYTDAITNTEKHNDSSSHTAYHQLCSHVAYWKWLYKYPVTFFFLFFLLGIIVLLTLTSYNMTMVAPRKSLRNTNRKWYSTLRVEPNFVTWSEVCFNSPMRHVC